MNKVKLFGVLALSATVLLAGNTAFAADPDPLKTDATVKFEVDEGPGNIIEPDPADGKDEIIKVPGGKTGSGAIRLQFVPNFVFGTHAGISADKADIPVQLLEMKNADGSAPHGKGVVAPFVQVTDGRGLDGEEDEEAAWRLEAVATQFKDVNNDKNTLGDSYISINGSTLTTTMGDDDLAKTMVSGLAGTENKISTEATKPTLIMKTNEKQSTSGYQVSNVFHSGYTKGMDYPATGKAPINKKTEGVILHKAKNVVPLADVDYASTITWTLTVGK